jgi:tryptophan-rich sensory protein
VGRSILGLVGWIAVSFGAAAVGGLFGPGEWYATLNKPSWNPPSWIFGPVWTLLYAMMGIAAWLVWKERGWRGAALPLSLFLLQLILNAAWSWLFFGLHRPGLALADIAALWISILATLIAFWRVRPAAGALLIPYLAWVTFATVLNAELWRRNPVS